MRPDDNLFTDDSGYVVSTFNCARLALEEKCFEDAVKFAISYGGDTDTNAAVVGGLAGLVFGIEDIPEKWLRSLRGFTFKPTNM